MANKKRVLVIDDDPDFADFCDIVLTAHDYAVTKTRTVAEALAGLQEAAPDVIIVDVMLSYKLDGWSVLREIKSSEGLGAIPVLLVSAVVRGGEEQVFPKDTALWDRFLRKPISPDELVTVLQELISHSGDKETV